MTIAPGSRLGPYEIVAPLGAGGMGEVYRARDTRLDRTVAVKILPAEFAADARLKIRFDREAKAISALSHPHICALYDVGPDYLVMEHCDGQTLAQRLSRGALPMAQVIEYGMEIADALDKAHRAAIIHRDLKPANIMITKSGVKLLDFGLARRQTASSPDESTVQQVTEEGKIAGTVQYMAPELFQGKEADARSDIFALGLVLYEMATGKPAFSGTSKASLIAAILEHEAPHVEGQSALDRLIRACLEKDPNERIQSAHDVLLQLRWTGEPGVAPARVWNRRLFAASIVVTLAVAIAGFTAWRMLRQGHASVRAARFQLQPPPGVVLDPDPRFGVIAPAVSPNGEWVVFGGRGPGDTRAALYLRSTKQLDATPVTGTRGARDPFFSPDSKWLGFHADGALQKILVEGGPPIRICATRNMRGASWGDDGTILFSDGQSLMRVSADGGEPRPVTAPRLPERHYWPHVLPGSTHALITITRGMSDQLRKIGVLSLADGRIFALARGTSARYARDRIVYDYGGKLFSLPFDAARLKTTGEPQRVLEDVLHLVGSGNAFFDVSTDGSLVYMPYVKPVPNSEVVWLDRLGQVTRATGGRPFASAVLSPNGKTMAAATREGGEDSDAWAFDLQRGGSTRLTTGMMVEQSLAWFPDGRSLVIASKSSGMDKLFRVSADGSGTPQQLTFGANNSDAAPAVSPDGMTVMFMRASPPADFQLMTLSLASPDPPQPFVLSNGREAYPAFSPDGRWVAYESDETGEIEVHVRPFPAREPRVTVSVKGGGAPFWSADGRELFYLKGKELWSVAVSTDSGFRSSVPKRLFTAPWLTGSWGERLQACPDGGFVTVRMPPGETPEWRIVYAPQWIDELKQSEK